MSTPARFPSAAEPNRCAEPLAASKAVLLTTAEALEEEMRWLRPEDEAVVDQGGTSNVVNIHYEPEELEVEHM
uniref:Uncharacterized protein n=1 Tax=Sphaerodactylus townsendi TaxID=933632 RepID=A0ACB8ELH8_9SAUR